MGFGSFLKKFGGIAAGLAGAPFTGGMSLTALLPSIIGAGTDVAGMLINRHGINNAQKAQLQSILESQGLLKEGLGKVTESNQPYIDFGNKAMGTLSGMLDNGQLTSGINDVNFNFDPNSVMQDIRNDPGYQFMVDQGEQATKRLASARAGGIGGGGLLKALTQYREGMASQEYGNAFNRQFQLAGANYNAGVGNRNAQMQNRQNIFGNLNTLAQYGPQAASRNQQATLGTYGDMAGLQTEGGNVRAGSSIANAQNWSGGLQNLGYSLGKIFSGRRRSTDPNFSDNLSQYGILN
jgi:hypothetical protein